MCLENLPIGWCNTQWPVDDVQYQGTAVSVYGRVWINGVTSGTEIDNGTNTSTPEYPQLIAQVGYGDAGTSALTWPVENWSAPAVPYEDYGNDDEFVVKNLFTSLVQGEYDFVFRFSGDSGSTWTYCNANRQDTLGYNGTTGEIPYDLSKNGHLEILEVLCGNNVCDIEEGEDPYTCSKDCDPISFCGNNICDDWEDELICFDDCQTNPCDPNPCVDPPSNYCETEYTLIVYQFPGICLNMGGGIPSCEYSANFETCMNYCSDGVCY